jgi:hypothetical protein
MRLNHVKLHFRVGFFISTRYCGISVWDFSFLSGIEAFPDGFVALPCGKLYFRQGCMHYIFKNRNIYFPVHNNQIPLRQPTDWNNKHILIFVWGEDYPSRRLTIH